MAFFTIKLEIRDVHLLSDIINLVQFFYIVFLFLSFNAYLAIILLLFSITTLDTNLMKFSELNYIKFMIRSEQCEWWTDNGKCFMKTFFDSCYSIETISKFSCLLSVCPIWIHIHLASFPFIYIQSDSLITILYLRFRCVIKNLVNIWIFEDLNYVHQSWSMLLYNFVCVS